jgi:hypothetical protein
MHDDACTVPYRYTGSSRLGHPAGLKRAVKSPGGPIRWTLEGWMHRGLVWRFGFDWLLLSGDFWSLLRFLMPTDVDAQRALSFMWIFE